MRRIGIGYRWELQEWLKANRELVDSIEVTAEHFFGFDELGTDTLQALGKEFPTFVPWSGIVIGHSRSALHRNTSAICPSGGTGKCGMG